MRIVKKIIIWTFSVLFLLIGSGILLAWIFEDEIHLYAIRELGKKLNARIEVNETELSFFKSFPKVNVELKDLRINAEESQDPDDFIQVDRAAFQVNFWSFFSERYEIAGVKLYNPDVRMILRADGKWNFADVFRQEPSLDPKEGNDVIFALQKVKLYGGRYAYVDEAAGTSIRLDSIDLGLSGDLSGKSSDVECDFRFFFDHWRAGNIKYVDRRWVNADLDVLADYAENPSYRINSADVHFAALALDVTGMVEQKEGGVWLDLEYTTNENTFDSFLSMLPGKWLDTGRKYEYGGDFRLAGWVRGMAGKGQAPDCFADYSVRRGTFQYVGYDSKVTEANVKGAFLYKPKTPQMSYFKVDQMQALLNGKEMHGNVSYTNFEDPELDLAAFGEILMQDIRDFYPSFADKSELSGRMFVDVKAKGKIQDFKGRNYNAISAAGTVRMDTINIIDPRLAQPVRGLTGEVRVDNSKIHVLAMVGEIGTSDFDFNGQITQYLPRFFNKESAVVAEVRLKSRNLNLNEFLEKNGPVPGAVAEKDKVYDLELPQWLNLHADAQIGHFELAKFSADSLRGDFTMENQRFIVPSLRMKTLEGDVDIGVKMRVQDPNNAHVELTAKANGVNIKKTLGTFDQLAAFALVEENLSGEFSGNVFVKGTLDRRLRLREESIASHGDYEIKNGRLVNFEPLEGLAGFVKLEKLRDIHFSDVQSSYRVEDKYVYLPDLEVQANEYNLHVSGRHGFDNSLDYRVAVEMPRREAKGSKSSEVQEWIDESEPDAIRVVIPIRVTGTVDNPKFSLDGQYVKNSVKQEFKNQKEDLANAYQKETDDLFGKQDNTNVQDWIIEEGKDTTGQNNVGNFFKKIKNPFKKKADPTNPSEE